MAFTKLFVVNIPAAQVDFTDAPQVELPFGVETDSFSVVNQDAAATVYVAVNAAVSDKGAVVPVQQNDMILTPSGTPEAAWTVPSRARKLWFRLSAPAAGDVEVHVTFVKEK